RVTATLNTPPPAAAGHHERPFTRDPGRWERERSRALRTGHVPGPTCSAACELVLVHERTPWGWLAWTVPGDGSSPEIPTGSRCSLQPPRVCSALPFAG